jgi:hypothetical protein
VPETEDKPDLDELLELLGAPDEAPRRKRIPGSVWLMLALVLSFAGIWLALRTAMGTAAARIAGPPVLPTKVSERPAPGRESPIAEVVEDYLERCRKGMTAREVRWIVEDFQKAGLDEGLRSAPPEAYIRQRKAQHAWYLGLLADGLRLDARQRETAGGRLAGLLDESAAAFRDAIEAEAGKPFEQEGRRFQVVAGGVVSKLIDASQWLADERYAPWELCELTEEQLQLTWHPILERIHGSAEEFPDWLDVPSSSLVSFESGAVSLVEDLPMKASKRGSVPVATTHLETAGSVFPVPDVSLPSGPAHESELIRELRSYHSSQLKLLLLLDPEAGDEIASELAKSNE